MSLDPISSITSASKPSDLAMGAPAPKPNAAELKRAAQQFEAIMVRQLLGPSIEPIMKGGDSSEGAGAGGGGGNYAYMITDMLADNISKAGGLGLASVITRQFQTATPVAHAK